jgi:hypothetical protein
MKKQISILTMLTLTLFLFSSNKSFAQNPEVSYVTPSGSIFCPTANTLTCTSTTNGLAPVPGVPYDYEITVPAGSTVHWVVTDETAIMTGPGALTSIIDPGTGLGNYLLTTDAVYNNAANTSSTITLTWQSFDGLANEVLLVAYVRDATTNWCTDNIEVYRIIPEYTFTLDIAGLLDDGTEGTSECVGNIKSATYDVGTRVLNVVYDSNYVFFAINAANWKDSWMPDLSAITDLAGSSVDVTWAYPDEAISNTGPWNATTVEVEATHYASNQNGFIGQTGECIIVRVAVDHVTTENLADQLITLSVDGEMIDPSTGTYTGNYPDLDDDPSGCVAITETIDYIITARPDIDESDPTPFEEKDPQED